MTALKIEYLSLDKLTPYEKNSRTHSSEQVKQIAASIKEFGFTNPILIDENSGIIAGHGRLIAAQQMRLKTVPVVRLSHLTPEQKKAYIIADNKLALNAGWDLDLLKGELLDLKELNFDLGLIGFDAQELESLLSDNEKIKELQAQNYEEVFNIIIVCETECEQEKIFNKLQEEGYQCRVQSL